MRTLVRRRGKDGPILETIATEEAKHSVEVSRNAKGDFAYTIKLYTENVGDTGIAQKAKAIFDACRLAFEGIRLPSEEEVSPELKPWEDSLKAVVANEFK